MKRTYNIALHWISLVIILVGAVFSFTSNEWLYFGFDVAALLSIAHFLFLLLR